MQKSHPHIYTHACSHAKRHTHIMIVKLGNIETERGSPKLPEGKTWMQMGSVAQYFILDNDAMTESFGSFKLNFFKLKFPIKLNYHFKIKECIFNHAEVSKENYLLWESNGKNKNDWKQAIQRKDKWLSSLGMKDMSRVSSARQTGKLTGDEHPQTQLRVSEESEVGLIPSTQKP